MRSVLVALATMGLAAFTGTPAAEQTEAPTGPARTPPDWALPPDAEAIARHYPSRAQRLEVEGGAIISCSLDTAGKLSGCQAVEESPEGLGFGEAAVAMAAEFRMKPATIDSEPVATQEIRIPIRFRLPPKEEQRWSLGQVGVALGVFAMLVGVIVIVSVGRRRRPTDV